MRHCDDGQHIDQNRLRCLIPPATARLMPQGSHFPGFAAGGDRSALRIDEKSVLALADRHPEVDGREAREVGACRPGAQFRLRPNSRVISARL